MTTVPEPQTLTELKLSDELKRIIIEAYVPNELPIIVSYVDEIGDPATSFRGSAVAFGDTAIAVWTRRSDSGMVKAAEKNQNFLLLYRQPGPLGERSRAVITFRGRARISANESERRTVYDTMVQRERDADKDYNGVAIIVDLASVIGQYPGVRLQMRK